MRLLSSPMSACGRQFLGRQTTASGPSPARTADPSRLLMGRHDREAVPQETTQGIQTDGFATISQNIKTTAVKAGTPSQNHTRANAR